MQFGMPTLIELKAIESCAALCQELGLSFVEFNMHLHDHSKSHGDHLPLGEGELDLTKYLDIAQKHHCRTVLETKTVDGLRKSVSWLKERGYLRLYKTPRNSRWIDELL